MSTDPRSTRRLTAVAAAAVFAGCMGWYSWDLGSHEHYHRDEANWIATSQRSFQAFFVRGDFSRATWDESLNTFGRENPHGAKFLIGAGLWFQGHREVREVRRWDADSTMQERIAQGTVPGTDELRAARLPVVVTAASTAALLVLLFGFLQPGLSGVLGGLLAAGIFTIHPLSVQHGRTVMLDMPAVCLSAASILFTLHAERSLRARRATRGLACGALAAACAGLALSCKLNAVLVVAAVALAALWNWWEYRTRASAAFATACALLPPLVFLGLNPYLWHQGMEGVRNMLDLGNVVADRRDHLAADALWTWSEKLAAGYSRALRNPVAALAGGAGALLLLGRPRRWMPVVLWMLVVTAGVLAWTPLSYGRYYLPLVPLVALAISHAAVEGMRAFLRLRRSRPPSGEAIATRR